MKKKTMRELCNGKMWVAVEAMITGLQTIPGEKFYVNMNTYGEPSIRNPGVCFGCAATCAVQKLTGVMFEPDTISPSPIRLATIGAKDLLEFEATIDALRSGHVDLLVMFFDAWDNITDKGVGAQLGELESPLPPLENSNWRERLDDYKPLLDFLKKHDL